MPSLPAAQLSFIVPMWQGISTRFCSTPQQQVHGHRHPLFALGGPAFSWLRPRTASVIVQGATSNALSMQDMVFHGTVWGPPLWNVFYVDAKHAIQAAGFYTRTSVHHAQGQAAAGTPAQETVACSTSCHVIHTQVRGPSQSLRTTAPRGSRQRVHATALPSAVTLAMAARPAITQGRQEPLRSSMRMISTRIAPFRTMYLLTLR